MTNAERVKAILHYQDYDKLPVVHFGFWDETLEKWRDQGHITAQQAQEAIDGKDGTDGEKCVADKLGFDFNWNNCFCPNARLFPEFEKKVIRQHPDGTREVLDVNGVIILPKDDASGIPTHVGHLLEDRKGWEEHYLPRLQFSEDRVLKMMVNTDNGPLPFGQGGLDYLKNDKRENPIGLFCGSLFGEIRNWLGLEGISYLYMDDEKLYDEIIDTVAELCYKCTEITLAAGAKFDFGHFWEDICFKSGPLVIPSVFDQKVGPHYKRITELVNKHGIDIVSLDCDGVIDALIPTWFNNGVNTMFPIEVGTWDASLTPWREKFGQELRGVGGMNKTLFARDYATIDAEIERLKSIVELGGYIPCPDHRLAPDSRWENVQYYCEKMREIFS